MLRAYPGEVPRLLCTWLLLAAPLLAAAAGDPQTAPEPLKVAFLYEHPINAGGWSQSHERARRQAVAHFDGAVTITPVEGVRPGPDTVRVLGKLARDGYDMIFATSFGHMNPVIKVARRFPDISFEHASGYKQAPNVGTYQVRAYEGRYLAGRLAGAMTESQQIGYLGAFPIPEVIRGINAFTLGVRSVNPDAVVKLIWINTWLDPSREREATELLIRDGADVVTHHSETAAVAVAAEAAGAWVVGYQFDRSRFAPTRHLVTVEHNWLPIYLDKIQARLEGRWQSTNLWPGLDRDVTRLVGLAEAVPQPVRDDLETVRQAIADGRRQVFSGPLKDNGGRLRLPAGETLDAAAALQMDFLVEGVDGSL